MRLVVPIIAAGWIEIAISVVVFGFYLLSHLASAMNNKPAKPPAAPKPRGPAAAPQQPRTMEEKLRGEVEEFLRQVQGEPARPAQAPQQRPTTVIKRPLVVKVGQPVETVIELEPVRESLQEHVAKHISTADVGQNAATLGAEVGLADDKMLAHLQQKFQHQLGALEPRQTQPATSQRRQNAAAIEIANLLRSPHGMRQVIVASEILRRPEI